MKQWNFVMKKNRDVLYFTIPVFDETGLVKSCFTSRIGGVSQNPYNYLNLGTNTEDSKENIRKNYKIICNALEIDANNIVISHQVHKDNILIVNESHKNSDIFESDIKEIDGLITDKPGIALVTLYADCVPIFILDKRKKIIALAHAGWKGTVKKIGKKVINRMVSIYKTDPKDCIVGIGPSIGECCYEVDDFVISQFHDSYDEIKSFILTKGNGKYMLNLWEANKKSLLEAGVSKSNITISNICTKCNNDIFYSYRGENGKTGRMAAIAQLY